jgi:hypothetical protein
MNRNEDIFLLAGGIGAAVIEIASIYGAGICLFLPVMLTILYIGLKVFPDKSKNVAEQE